MTHCPRQMEYNLNQEREWMLFKYYVLTIIMIGLVWSIFTI